MNAIAIKNARTTQIDNLMQWRANGWFNYEKNSGDLHLHIHYDQLIITSGSRVLETLNLKSKIKGFYKNCVFILIILDSKDGVRKIKFQLKQNSELLLQNLNAHFPILGYKTDQKCFNLQYRNLNDIFHSEIGKDVLPVGLPNNFQDFVKLCILDPDFPNIVHETQKIIDSMK